MVKAILVAVLFAAACTKPPPSPGPQPAPAPSPSPAVVFGELVEAGCVAAAPAGPTDIAAEYALDGGGFGWLNCLFDGGSVASCQVPCDAAAGVKLRR